MKMSARSCIVLLLVVTLKLAVVEGRKIKSDSQCSEVKKSFMDDKPTVAATITAVPEYDGSLELCRFTNHSESKRLSCCTHDTENELLKTAQAEYTAILTAQTTDVLAQMEPGRNLQRHFERMLAISKRMTEYEMGRAFNLHHILGRESIHEFYEVLEAILLRYDRSTSMFIATDNLVDNLFIYAVREAVTPGSTKEPNVEYAECVKQNRRALNPPAFAVQLQNQATSLHYSAVAASYLAEAMDVTFEALNATRDFEMSHHCLRDLMKLNHCQKCYGYSQMRPCREFCEDVFLVCLNRVVRLGSNWEYHRKIIKILSEYILNRVELQSLLNTFHTELKSQFDQAIMNYPTYKKQLQGLCGAPRFDAGDSRLKSWDKPQTTSYEGDFTGDLRKLVVNLELNIQGFYSNIHASICANEPTTRMTCWDGLTERVNKKKNILEFEDEFAPYPDKNEEVFGLITHIKKIRHEVLKIFLKTSNQDSDDEIDGSGSGDGDYSEESDTEPGDDGDEPIPTRSPNLLVNKPPDAVTSRLSTIYQDGSKDSSIEIVDRTPRPSVKTSRPPPPDKSPVKNDSPPGSSGTLHTCSLLLATANIALVYLLVQH